MLKIAGALLLLFSALFAGVSLRRDERRRIANLSASVSLLRHARRKIELFQTPTDSLFVDFSDGFDVQIRKIFAEKKADEALSILAEQLSPHGEPLLKFAREIGCGYKEDALHLCDYCIEQMKSAHETAEESFSRRKKLYTSLPLLLAISIIVLFI